MREIEFRGKSEVEIGEDIFIKYILIGEYKEEE